MTLASSPDTLIALRGHRRPSCTTLRAFTRKVRTDIYLGTLRAPDWMPAAIISRILA